MFGYARFDCTFGGDIIKSVSEATYLGVTISNNFGSRSSHGYAHISSVAASDSQRLGFLHRNLRGSPYRMRELAFEALVRSTLNYCWAIWDPSVQREIQKLEMIQNRGARWVWGARGVLAVFSFFRDLGWLSLYQRLCLFYKLLNNIIDVNTDELDITYLKIVTLVKLVDNIPTRLLDSTLPTRTLPCGPPQCPGPFPSGITSVLHHSKLAQLPSLRASSPPDHSAHLPTSAFCLIRGDWGWSSTQFTCRFSWKWHNTDLSHEWAT